MSKTYFLAPTRDCPPSGPISLGSIIASPADPELPINPPLPIDTTLNPIHEKHEENWRLELSKHNKGKVGLWLSFLQMAGVGADASISYENSTTSVYHFKRLSTRTFWPTKDYIVDSVMAPEVQAFLKSRRFHHNVYMITGISVAIGAHVATSALRKRGFYFQLGVDATAQGLPASVGPELDVESSKTEGVSYHGASDFVFAFRLREIRYTTRKGVSTQEYTKGALYGLEDKVEHRGDAPASHANKKDPSQEQHFVLLGLAEEDVSAEEVDGDAQEAEDMDEELCEVVQSVN